jgi:hypothetical protein
MGSDAWLDSDVEEDIRRFSPALRMRLEGPTHGLVSESIYGNLQDAAGTQNRSPEHKLMGHIRLFDTMAIRVIWRASEAQARSEGREGDAVKARAAQIAERVVRRTQPTFWGLDQSGMQLEARKNKVFASLFTFFRSQKSKSVSTTYRRYWEYKRGEISRAQFSASVAEILILQSLWVTLVRSAYGGALTYAGIGLATLLGYEEEEEKEEDDTGKNVYKKMRESDSLLKSLFMGVAETATTNWIGGDILFYIANTILTKERSMDPMSNPLFSSVEAVAKSVKSIGVNVINAVEEGRLEEIKMWDLIEDSLDVFFTAGGITKGMPGLPLFRQLLQVTKQTKEAREERKKQERKVTPSRRGKHLTQEQIAEIAQRKQ